MWRSFIFIIIETWEPASLQWSPFKNSDSEQIFSYLLTAQKIRFSIKNFFSKCDQIHSLLLIWSHLLKKSFIENFILVQCGFCRNELAPNTKLNLKYEKLSSNLDVCSTSTRPIGKSDDFIRRLIDTYST